MPHMYYIVHPEKKGKGSQMKKTSSTILIIILIFIALGLSGVLISALASPGGVNVTYGMSNVILVNTQEIEMKDIKDIDILYNNTSLDIDFFENSSDTMIIKEYMFPEVEDRHLAVINCDEDTGRVTVESGDRRSTIMFFGIMTGSERIEVYLPKGYHGSLKAKASSGNISSDFELILDGELGLSTSSGDIRMNPVSASNIQAKASSGNIRIDSVQGTRSFQTSSGDIQVFDGKGDTKASASSGNITIKQLQGDYDITCNSGDITLTDVAGDGELQTSSGNIRCQSVSGTIKRAKSSSGDIIIDDFIGAINANSSSGNITVAFDEVTGDVTARANSGDVRLTISDSYSFTFDANTSSGDIRTWFDDDLKFNKKGNEAEGTVGASPAFDMRLETTSGNVTITR